MIQTKRENVALTAQGLKSRHSMDKETESTGDISDNDDEASEGSDGGDSDEICFFHVPDSVEEEYIFACPTSPRQHEEEEFYFGSPKISRQQEMARDCSRRLAVVVSRLPDAPPPKTRKSQQSKGRQHPRSSSKTRQPVAPLPIGAIAKCRGPSPRQDPPPAAPQPSSPPVCSPRSNAAPALPSLLPRPSPSPSHTQVPIPPKLQLSFRHIGQLQGVSHLPSFDHLATSLQYNDPSFAPSTSCSHHHSSFPPPPPYDEDEFLNRSHLEQSFLGFQGGDEAQLHPRRPPTLLSPVPVHERAVDDPSEVPDTSQRPDEHSRSNFLKGDSSSPHSAIPQGKKTSASILRKSSPGGGSPAIGPSSEDVSRPSKGRSAGIRFTDDTPGGAPRSEETECLTNRESRSGNHRHSPRIHEEDSEDALDEFGDYPDPACCCEEISKSAFDDTVKRLGRSRHWRTDHIRTRPSISLHLLRLGKERKREPHTTKVCASMWGCQLDVLYDLVTHLQWPLWWKPHCERLVRLDTGTRFDEDTPVVFWVRIISKRYIPREAVLSMSCLPPDRLGNRLLLFSSRDVAQYDARAPWSSDAKRVKDLYVVICFKSGIDPSTTDIEILSQGGCRHQGDLLCSSTNPLPTVYCHHVATFAAKCVKAAQRKCFGKKAVPGGSDDLPIVESISTPWKRKALHYCRLGHKTETSRITASQSRLSATTSQTASIRRE